jgi:hypothetical protein
MTSPLPPGEGQGEGINKAFSVIDFFRVIPWPLIFFSKSLQEVTH